MILEQQNVVFPELILVPRTNRSLRGGDGVRVEIERQVSIFDPQLARIQRVELLNGVFGLATEGALIVAEFDDCDRRVNRSSRGPTGWNALSFYGRLRGPGHQNVDLGGFAKFVDHPGRSVTFEKSANFVSELVDGFGRAKPVFVALVKISDFSVAHRPERGGALVQVGIGRQIFLRRSAGDQQLVNDAVDSGAAQLVELSRVLCDPTHPVVLQPLVDGA